MCIATQIGLLVSARTSALTHNIKEITGCENSEGQRVHKSYRKCQTHKKIKEMLDYTNMAVKNFLLLCHQSLKASVTYQFAQYYSLTIYGNNFMSQQQQTTTTTNGLLDQ